MTITAEKNNMQEFDDVYKTNRSPSSDNDWDLYTELNSKSFHWVKPKPFNLASKQSREAGNYCFDTMLEGSAWFKAEAERKRIEAEEQERKENQDERDEKEAERKRIDDIMRTIPRFSRVTLKKMARKKAVEDEKNARLAAILRKKGWKSREKKKAGCNKTSAWHMQRKKYGVTGRNNPVVKRGEFTPDELAAKKEKREKKRKEKKKFESEITVVPKKEKRTEYYMVEEEVEVEEEEKSEEQLCEEANEEKFLNDEKKKILEIQLSKIEKEDKIEEENKLEENKKHENDYKLSLERKQLEKEQQKEMEETKAFFMAPPDFFAKKKKEKKKKKKNTVKSTVEKGWKVAGTKLNTKREEAMNTLANVNEIANKKHCTKMCNSVVTGVACKHGNQCRFAHSTKELAISDCFFGKKCRFVDGKSGFFTNCTYTHKVCLHKHPRESDTNFYARTGLEQPIKVVKKIVPKTLPMPTPAETVTMTKTAHTPSKPIKSRWGPECSGAPVKAVVVKEVKKEKVEKTSVCNSVLKKVKKKMCNSVVTPEPSKQKDKSRFTPTKVEVGKK